MNKPLINLSNHVYVLIIYLTLITNVFSNPLIIAHRGASGEAPENTMDAFKLAWELGADGIEGDFHLTHDGHIVAIHDKDTNKVTKGKNKLIVKKTNLQELQKIDVGSWKNEKYFKARIPTLEEVIDSLPMGKKFFIEIKCGTEIIQTSLPEAILEENNGRDFLSGKFNSKLKTIAIGPGIGTLKSTISYVESVFKNALSPLIVDADAINIISKNKNLLNILPENSILTPHPKEFERLVGIWGNDEEKLFKLKKLSSKYKIIIILKGAHTCISLPSNIIWPKVFGAPPPSARRRIVPLSPSVGG